MDVAEVEVESVQNSPEVEQFTIEIKGDDNGNPYLNFLWDKTQVLVQIQQKQPENWY